MQTRRTRHAYSGAANDIADQIPDLQAATEENYMLQEEFESLEQALFQLSERDRNLLYFKYNMDLTDKEIAGLLGIPAQHVRQYVARAKRRAFQMISKGENDHVRDE
jgi:RNA polymerase sigma factor, sigma-70 family